MATGNSFRARPGACASKILLYLWRTRYCDPALWNMVTMVNSENSVSRTVTWKLEGLARHSRLVKACLKAWGGGLWFRM
jgi:hypothetical protein